MHSLPDYFSPEHGKAFANALPELRRRIGCTSIEQRSDDFGVGGNTFRAYRNWPLPPSSIYREWAESIYNNIDANRLADQVYTAEGFREWHISLAESLQAHWKVKQGEALSFAHQYKLIDLFIKWLSGYNFGIPQLTNAFMLHGNCALDSQTLSKLNECLSFALPLTRPSMGDIHSWRTYDFCQTLIGRFTDHYGGTRLLFDYFAWQPGNRD